MSPAARTAVLVLGTAMVAGGAALMFADPGGIALVLMGGLVLASVLLERRSRRGSARPGGAGAGSQWQQTGEREIDSETGAPMAVWFDPVTGARRYLPLDERP